MIFRIIVMLTFILAVGSNVHAAEVKAEKVLVDISNGAFDDAIWSKVHEETVSLMAQPMALPRPKTTETAMIRIQSIHDGNWIAFRLRWSDTEKSEAGILGKFSDAVAMQFPVKEGPPPPIFMGAKDNPVHIFHWRAQYQKDHEKGKPEMTDLYPNMNPDMYPMEFKDAGSVKGLNKEKREVYAHGKAAGNPQSSEKTSSVDEIYAEGFGSSAVVENRMAIGHGIWNKGEWSVVIARPLKNENGSTLIVGKDSYLAFAVWQGGKGEVGSRKCVTMSWVPLKILALGGKS